MTKGYKAKQSPDADESTRTVYVGQYTAAWEQSSEHIKIAHLTYHNEDQLTAATLLPPTGVGEYVGFDHAGQCKFPGVFMSTDPTTAQGNCFLLSSNPAPVCAQKHGETRCTKAVFTYSPGMFSVVHLKLLNHIWSQEQQISCIQMCCKRLSTARLLLIKLQYAQQRSELGALIHEHECIA